VCCALVAIASSAARAEVPRERLIILPITPEIGVDPGETKLLDDLLSVSFSRFNELDAISANDVEELVAHEANKQALGCDDASCLAELSGAMGARYVVSGRIGKLGARYSLTISLFDSSKTSNVGRANRTGASLDEIALGLDAQVEDVVISLGVTLRSGATRTMKPAPALPPPDRAPADEDAVKLSGIGLTAGLCGAGACVGASTLIVEYIVIVLTSLNGSNASYNGRFDATDFVGVSVFCCGLGIGAIGLAVIPFTWFPDEPEPATESPTEGK